MSSLVEAAYNALPSGLQSKIDEAFDSVLRRNDKEPSSSSRPRSPRPGGGFIVEDTPMDEAEDISGTADTHIPFSLIPDALELLDLPPDDEQILSVFRNAVEDEDDPMNGEDGMKISRQRWRAVCAVLLEGSDDVDMEDSQPEAIPPAPKAPPTRPRRSKAAYRTPIQSLRDESDKDTDEYADSGDSDDAFEADDPDSGEEFTVVGKGKGKAVVKEKAPTRAPTRATSSKRKAASTSRDTVANSSKTLSPAQEEACASAFALFFPSVPSGSDKKRIMIKDLQLAAKTVGEKINADEFLEMLEMFSTSPDKSISILDFQRVMVSTKLI